MEKKVTSPLMNGLLISLILIVLDLVGGFTHIKFETWWRWIPTIVMFVVIIWMCINYANQKNNYVTFGNVFKYGLIVSAILAGIMVVYSYISVYLIFPETIDVALDQTRKQLEAKGTMSDDQIQQGVEMTRKFFGVGIFFIAIFTFVFGLIASLLGAAFAKKKPVTPFDQPTA